jgi:hypothetical protein
MGRGNVVEREKKRKRSPLLPLLGFVALIGFCGLSWVIAPYVRFLMTANLGVTFPKDLPAWQVNGAVAVALFIFLFAISMAIVALAAGVPADPLDVRSPTTGGRRRRRK